MKCREAEESTPITEGRKPDQDVYQPGEFTFEIGPGPVIRQQANFSRLRRSSGKQARIGNGSGRACGKSGTMTIPAEQVFFFDDLLYENGHSLQQAVPIE